MPEFALTELTATPFAFVSRICPMSEIGPTLEEGFSRLSEAFSAAGTAPVGPPLAHYRRLENGAMEFDLGFPVRPDEAEGLLAAGLCLGQTAAGKAVTGIHTGPYDRLPQTYDALLAEVRARGLEPAEDMWETYVSPPETPPDQTRVEVTWPVHQAA